MDDFNKQSPVMHEVIHKLFWKKLHGRSLDRFELYSMSRHPYLTEEMIRRYPHHQWNWNALSHSRHFILAEHLPYKDWDWDILTLRFDLDVIMRTPYLPWDQVRLSHRLYPPILSDERREWIDRSRVASPDYICQNPSLPWKWETVLCRPDMMFHHAKCFPETSYIRNFMTRHTRFEAFHLSVSEKIDYKILSHNPYLSQSILSRFPNLPWDWSVVARHPAFPPQSILNNPLFSSRWRWDHSLQNPRLTQQVYDTIRKNFTIHNHFTFLSQNHFEHSPVVMVYFQIVRERFLRTLFRRRLILRKLRLLCRLSHTISRHELFVILSFV